MVHFEIIKCLLKGDDCCCILSNTDLNNNLYWIIIIIEQYGVYKWEEQEWSIMSKASSMAKRAEINRQKKKIKRTAAFPAVSWK